jgi:glutamyl-tRNA synthetase
MSNVRVRFAPSPTGSLHIGGVRTALWDWLFARHHGGKFILRIEDTDKNRETPDGVQVITDSLRWYGLDWDEGPDVGGPYGPYTQSQRLPIYHEYAEKLIASGMAYRAYDTAERLKEMREEQEKKGLPTGYDRRHRYLTDAERAAFEDSGTPPVVRLAVPQEGKTTFTDPVHGDITFEHRVVDDAVLLKSDGYPTYHLASVVDDHLMEISHVLRGEDWISSAPIHMLLYQAFGWEPPVIAHLPNILGPDRKKLSKRHMAVSALLYRDEGYLVEAMINFLALQGWSAKEDRDLYSREDLIEKFSLEGILNRSPISDPAKLLWYNGQYIRSLPLDELARRITPYLQTKGLVGDSPDAATMAYLGEIIPLIKDRMEKLSDAPDLAEIFLLPDDALEYDDAAVAKWFTQPAVADRLRRVRDGFAALDEFTEQATEALVRATVTELGVKGGEVFHPVRVAVSGRTTGPGLFEMIAVLGKDRVLRRLDRAIDMMAHIA